MTDNLPSNELASRARALAQEDRRSAMAASPATLCDWLIKTADEIERLQLRIANALHVLKQTPDSAGVRTAMRDLEGGVYADLPAAETGARKSLPPGPARIAAQIAHATYHIIDDYGAEDAQTGDMNVEIPAHDLKEWNRVVDLLGDDPHEVLHDLIGVNDPMPSEETAARTSSMDYGGGPFDKDGNPGPNKPENGEARQP